ncbi:MAG: 4-hydroxy-tetrahydrodipicolinate reductase [Bacillota bacterium]|nr:4-hydroxy-tetrahydrodipicolinate reductase [Bacillota bacterium]MDK2959871.1 4-hydroxy-tetrahydrodipicolinate reductase [Bacillota bacterium]
MGIRVLVSGANGRMGREVVKGILADPDLDLVGAVGHENGIGQDVGILIGREPLGIELAADLGSTISRTGAEVVVDFTRPAVVKKNLETIAKQGAHAVIGTTGITEADIPEIAALYREQGVNAVIAPNFAVGAVLLLKFAAQAARFFPQVEIIETHHDQKLDAPSGTAIKYAEAIARAAGDFKPAPTKVEKVPGVRGGELAGIKIHSLRLPGFVAHHTIVFGGLGQSLTLKHDSISRESFIPGVILAVKKVSNLDGVVYGLENLLEI